MVELNVVVLAAARATYDRGDGEYPVCVREHEGVSLLEHTVRRVETVGKCSFSFAFLDEHIAQYHLDNIARQLVPDATITHIVPNVRGALVSALLSCCEMDEQVPLLVVSANELLSIDYKEVIKSFLDANVAAGTIIFDSLHPRYSYVSVCDEGLVTEAAQGRPISRFATAGIFWFATTQIFVEAAKADIRKAPTSTDLFFVAPILNQIILNGGKVGTFNILPSQYLPMKSGPKSRYGDSK